MPDGSLQSSAFALAPTSEHLLPLRGADLRITRKGRRLLDVDNIAFEGEGLTAILGPNGAGKSLLLRVLSGLVTPDEGLVFWGAGSPQRSQRRRLGFVFQRPVLLRRSALANVVYPLRAAGLCRREARDRALAALDQARLSHLAERPARVFSGGEQQRLALARALAAAPEILFLDEPTASLDPASVLAIEEMIARARDAGTRVVLVSHDCGQARRLADEVIFMNRGRLVERQQAETFFETPDSREARAYLSGEILF